MGFGKSGIMILNHVLIFLASRPPSRFKAVTLAFSSESMPRPAKKAKPPAAVVVALMVGGGDWCVGEVRRVLAHI